MAPLEVMPLHLKKAVAAIHLYPLTGTYSHFTRRVFNALLVLASRQWTTLTVDQQGEVYDKRIVPKFRSGVGDLKKALNLASNDRGYDRMYEAIDCLYRLEFRFDVMGDLGQGWTVASRIISQWAHAKDGSGLIEWEYPPDVFQMLMRPMPFARIDMALSNSLSSGYALALYENTCRYIHNPGQLTRRLTVEQWMGLISNSKTSYKGEYRYFKRYVIKPSLEELTASPACPLQLSLIESKGPRGKVTHLQFRVELKRQLPLPTEMGRGPDPRLARAIRKLGVSEKKLNELIVSMEEADLHACLDETLLKSKKGTLQNPAGYFVSACARVLDIDGISWESAVRGVLEERALSSEEQYGVTFSTWRNQRIRENFLALSEADQLAWTERFASSTSSIAEVKKKMAESGLTSTLADKVFYGWLMDQEEGTLLVNPEDRSLGEFVARQLKG
jgi:hypothetical protein